MYNRGVIVTDDEKQEIIKWANTTIANKIYKLGPDRQHYIMKDNDPCILPIIMEIKERIIQREDLNLYKTEESLGDFIIYIQKDGYVNKHTDPNKNDLLHTRFNVFIQTPEKGCDTYYDSNLVDCKEGTYALCRSGIDEHYITRNESDKARITLSYGWSLPARKLDALTADRSIGTYRFYPLSRNV